jgi:cathepsin A (carboxypeptidase C)
MKLTFAFLAVFVSRSVLAQEGNASLLRGTSTRSSTSTEETEEHLLAVKSSIAESSCSQLGEDECGGSQDDDGVQCVWCKCSAIPSECLNVEQAKAAPPGVFDCAPAPSPSVEEESASTTVSADSIGYNPDQFNYSLKESPVDGSLCDPDSLSISGYVDITGSKYDTDRANKHLFYWFFEKRSTNDEKIEQVQDAKDIPIVIWLTGGPGCSSTLALLFENGPCTVAEDGQSTIVNPYSWTEAAHVLWLDQPAGVGYSYGEENDYNEEMISEDAYYFLQEFLKEHPEYASNPVTIVGESYGGHYAPAVAHKIWTKNKDVEEPMIDINLAGLAVGNGLTNPIEQYQWYPEMAINNSHGIKVVSDDTYAQMKKSVPACIKLIEECNKGDSFINTFSCQSAFVVCNVAETTPYQMTGLNPYDITKQCGDNPLCYDFTNIETWLNLESTKEALNVSEHSSKWQSCNMGINLKFHTDWMKDFSPYVADLIDDQIHVLVYAGDLDYICNYLGNRAWTLNLEWKFKEDFNAAEDHEWGVDGDGSAGLAKTSNGFTFLQVYDAGHMVPADKPKVALDMISNFLTGGEF